MSLYTGNLAVQAVQYTQMINVLHYLHVWQIHVKETLIHCSLLPLLG